MKLNITARHFKMSPALTETVEKSIQSISQYNDNIISCDVILEKSELGDSVEYVIHVSGTTVVAKETESDLYKAIHASSDHVIRQLQKLKSKRDKSLHS